MNTEPDNQAPRLYTPPQYKPGSGLSIHRTSYEILCDAIRAKSFTVFFIMFIISIAFGAVSFSSIYSLSVLLDCVFPVLFVSVTLLRFAARRYNTSLLLSGLRFTRISALLFAVFYFLEAAALCYLCYLSLDGDAFLQRFPQLSRISGTAYLIYHPELISLVIALASLAVLSRSALLLSVFFCSGKLSRSAASGKPCRTTGYSVPALSLLHSLLCLSTALLIFANLSPLTSLSGSLALSLALSLLKSLFGIAVSLLLIPFFRRLKRDYRTSWFPENH